MSALTPQSNLEQALSLLNDDARSVYALTFDPIMQAFRVVRLTEVEHNTFRDKCKYTQRVIGQNHTDLTAAIKDALLLKLSGSVESSEHILK